MLIYKELYRAQAGFGGKDEGGRMKDEREVKSQKYEVRKGMGEMTN
jgi:hypothetical protein